MVKYLHSVNAPFSKARLFNAACVGGNLEVVKDVHSIGGQYRQSIC